MQILFPFQSKIIIIIINLTVSTLPTFYLDPIHCSLTLLAGSFLVRIVGSWLTDFWSSSGRARTPLSMLLWSSFETFGNIETIPATHRSSKRMRQMVKKRATVPRTSKDIDVIRTRSFSSADHCLRSYMLLNSVPLSWVHLRVWGSGFTIINGREEDKRKKEKTAMAKLILFPWLFFGQRWRTNNWLKTPLPISFTAKSLMMQGTMNRVKVGSPIPKRIVTG